MAINYFAPRQLSAVEYGGMPDIGEAIRSGFKTAREASDTAFKPHQLSAELLKAQLNNMINKPKAEHAEDITLADLANKRASTGLMGAQASSYPSQNELRALQIAAARREAENNKLVQDALRTGLTPPTNASNENAPAIPNTPGANPVGEGLAETMQTQKPNAPTVLSEGDPNLYNVDKLYSTQPALRKELEKRGYKQTQTVKIDPKTGASHIVRTLPSGRVELISQMAPSSTDSAITNTIRTSNQKVVNQAPLLLKGIEKLITLPSPSHYGNLSLSPNDRARNATFVKAQADNYIAAMDWPKTNESFHAAREILGRNDYETDAAYRKRLKEDIIPDIKERYENSQKILAQGTSLANKIKSGNKPSITPEQARAILAQRRASRSK